jgi:hypothetical protein
MALDPVKARYYMDDAPYRYGRPLYPGLSRLVAGGDPALVPIAMLIVNLFAVGAGTAIIALLLGRRRHSPWLALLYGVSPPTALSVHRDLSEPLAFALVLAGVLVIGGTHRWRAPGAGIVFGLAGLTRQTTLVFPVAYAASELLSGFRAERPHPWRPAAALLLFAVVPYVVWSVFIRVWLGALPTGQPPQLIPFVFLFRLRWSWARQPPELLAVVLPTLLWLAAATALVRARPVDAALACAAASAVAYVIFGPAYGDYPGAGRAALSVAVPMLLAYPTVMAAGRKVRHAYVLAFAAFAVVLPAVVLVDLFDVAGPH